MKPLPLVACAAPLLLPACLATGDDLGDVEHVAREVAAVDHDHSMLDYGRVLRQVVPPASGDIGIETTAGEPIVIYMNRLGGVFTPGTNNSVTNRSSIAPDTVNLPQWNPSPALWSDIMTCVRGQFAAFNVEITDIDPGGTPHIESVVAGSPLDLDPNLEGALGVSPFTTNCSMIPSSVVFTFPEVMPADAQLICEVVTQEVAHSFGLDHEFLCQDPMTYLDGCGPKRFQDTAAPCGEFEARACANPVIGYDCGSSTQNSVAVLTARLGLAPDTEPPLLSIVSPTEGQVVTPGFRVDVVASDNVAVQSVELLIDGVSVDSALAPPYALTAPATLELGPAVVEVVVRDGVAESRESIAVEVSDTPAPPGGEGPGGSGGGSGGSGSPGGYSGVTSGCSSSGGGSGLGAVLLLLALGLARQKMRAL